MSKKAVTTPLRCTPARARFAKSMTRRVVDYMQAEASSREPSAEQQVAAWDAVIEADAAYSKAPPRVFYERLAGGLLELRTSGGEPHEAAADAVMAAVAMVGGTSNVGCKVGVQLLRTLADAGNVLAKINYSSMVLTSREFPSEESRATEVLTDLVEVDQGSICRTCGTSSRWRCRKAWEPMRTSGGA